MSSRGSCKLNDSQTPSGSLTQHNFLPVNENFLFRFIDRRIYLLYLKGYEYAQTNKMYQCDWFVSLKGEHLMLADAKLLPESSGTAFNLNCSVGLETYKTTSIQYFNQFGSIKEKHLMLADACKRVSQRQVFLLYLKNYR